MKNEFCRTDGLFSLCGLNCGLCPMQIRGECSGCFNGSTCYQSCPIAPCSVRHGNVDYCFECPEYPCKRYDGIDRHDSLISHRNQKKDLMKAKAMGIDRIRESCLGLQAVCHVRNELREIAHPMHPLDAPSRAIVPCIKVGVQSHAETVRLVQGFTVFFLLFAAFLLEKSPCQPHLHGKIASPSRSFSPTPYNWE